MKCLLSIGLFSLLALVFGQHQGYDQACSFENNCYEPFNCTKGTCRCPVNHQYDKTSMTCRKFSQTTCQSDIECQDADVNRRCDSEKMCRCKDGFYFNSTDEFCYQKRSRGEKCHFNYQCLDQFSCKKPDSSPSGRCLCSLGKQWSSASKSCVSFEKSTCNNDDECQDWDPMRRCLSQDGQAKCRCEVFQNSKGFCTKGGIRNEDCYHTSDCRHNLTCTNRWCKCDIGYLWSDWQQKCLLFNESECQSDEQCQDQEPLMSCGGNATCTCRQGYALYDNTKCFPIQLMTPCQSNSDCPIDGSVCNQIKYPDHCTCPQTHVWSDGKCKRRNCESDSDCKSDFFLRENQMECKLSGCHCVNWMNAAGECQDLKFGRMNGKFWLNFFWFLFLGIIFMLLFTMTLAALVLIVRVLRTKLSGSTLLRGQVVQPKTTTAKTVEVPTFLTLSPDFVLNDPPPKYAEKQLPSNGQVIDLK